MLMPGQTSTPRIDRACFDGLLLSALAYGALVMLCVQVVQVLLHRPHRDQTFYLIIIYTSILFPLTTAAFLGKVNFAEMLYVANRAFPEGPKVYAAKHSDYWASKLSKICSIVMPWFADLLMFYRVFVLCGRQCWLLVLPLAIYLGRIAMSIPILMTAFHPLHPLPNADTYYVAQSAAYLALNVFITIVVTLRLYTMRHKAERVLGRLQASLYNSPSTLFVESGALFTLWSVVYLLLKVTNSWAQDVFWQPYAYVVALTRMLVVLRMAQNRAWTREIIDAADDGMLEWGVSSTGSIEHCDQRLRKTDTRELELDDVSSLRSLH